MLLYGQIDGGKRPRHRPKKTYRSCLKLNLKEMNMDVNNWEELSRDRAQWKDSIKKGGAYIHSSRTAREKFKRGLRKGTLPDSSESFQSWKCDICNRQFASKGGYGNHIRSHDTEHRVDMSVLPQRPAENVCVICHKVCKSAGGLKRHMHVHKETIPQADPINPVKCVSHICHICSRPCKSAAGLKAHLRAHARSEAKNGS
jgi:hypothetical protein